MLAACDGTVQRVARSGIAINSQQSQDRTGTPTHDVELLVGSNQLIGKKPDRAMRISKQVVIA